MSALVVTSATVAADAATATIKGTVIVRGKPLARGRILFHIGNDQFVGARIKDGAYRLDRVPAGARTVTIEGDTVQAIYSSEDKSPLRVEIKNGENNIDVKVDQPRGVRRRFTGPGSCYCRHKCYNVRCVA